MKTFNWCTLLICALLFAVGGTLAGLAAICLSGHALLSLFSIGMSAGLLMLAGLSIRMMERY